MAKSFKPKSKSELDSFAVLAAAAKEKNFAPVYVFSDGSARSYDDGDDNSRESLKIEALEFLRASFFKDEPDSLGFSTYDGKEASPADVFDEAQSGSLFGGRKMLVIRDAEPFLKAAGEILLKYLNAPSKDAMIVLVLGSLDGRTALAKELAKKASVLKFDPLRGFSVKRWIEHRAKYRHKREISPEALDALAEAVGGDVGVIDRELEKLTAYIGDRSKINVTDVLELTNAGRLHSVFELTDAIGARDRKTALTLAHRLFYEGIVLQQMLALISNQFEKLHEAFMFEQEGMARTDIPAQLQMHHPFVQEKFLGQMEKFRVPAKGKGKASALRNLQNIESKFASLLEADTSLKKSLKPELQIMEELIISLCN